MEVFVLDIKYQEILESCCECSDKVFLTRRLNGCNNNCVNNREEKPYERNEAILLYGVYEDKRVILRDLSFQPFFIVFNKHKDLVKSLAEKMGVLIYTENYTATLMREAYKGERSFCKVFFYSNDNRISISQILQRKGVEVFEVDIPIVSQYLSTRSVRIGAWNEVHGEPDIQLSSQCETYSVHYINPLTNPTVPPLRVMCFDIECQSHNGSEFPDPTEKKAYVAMIGITYEYKSYLLHWSDVSLKKSDEYISIRLRSELDMISYFFQLIKNLSPDIVIGYNVLSFDIAYLYRRICHMVDTFINISKLKAIKGTFHTLDWVSSAYGVNDFITPETFGVLFLDVMQYVKREFRFPKVSLNYVSEKLLGDVKEDLTPPQLFKCLAEQSREDMLRVAQYCIKDVNLTLQLYHKTSMIYGCVSLAQLTGTRIEELYCRGESRKIISLLYNNCVTSRMILTKEESSNLQLKGASVLEPKVGLHKNCTVVDFSSLYPSIVVANNICYSTYLPVATDDCHLITVDDRTHAFAKDREGVVPQFLRHLIAERKRYKDLMKKVDQTDVLYTIYDKRQNALKVCANSVYGCFGTKSIALLYFPEGAECVTAFGRKYIQESKLIIEENFPVEVVYGDTDSCMIKLSPTASIDECRSLSETIASKVSEHFPEGVNLTFETVYKNMLFVTKKKYAGLDALTGKIVTKGLHPARNDVCKFIKDVNIGMLTKILNGESKSLVKEYLDSKIEELANDQVDLKYLVMTTTLKGSYVSESYPASRFMKTCGRTYTPGTKLEYVVVDTDDKLQGDKWRDISYPFHENIDVDFYEERLRKSVESILKVLF